MSKIKLKVTNRERWVLALSPAVIIVGIYMMGYLDGLNKDLKTAQDRLTAARAPIKPPAPSAGLARAKSTLEETKRSITDHQTAIAKLETDISELSRSSNTVPDDQEPARVIERVEEVFSRNGITPLVSESAAEGAAASKVPTSLLNVLTPKLEAKSPAEVKKSRVWHYIFDDETPHFAEALQQLTQEVPSVVPLSANFVYNPRNDGETRQLELWILY